MIFFLLELSELERRRIKRLALLPLPFPTVGLVAADPALEPLDTEPLLLLLCPLTLLPSASESKARGGDRPALARLAAESAAGDVLCSIDDLRLLMLSRRGKMLFWCTEGGRGLGDFPGVVIDGEARALGDRLRPRLSVDGDFAPSKDSRRSLMKSLTTVKDDRLRGLGPSSSTSVSFPPSVSRSWDCDLRPFDNRRCSKDCLTSGCASCAIALGVESAFAVGMMFDEVECSWMFTSKGDCFKSRGSKSAGSALGSGTFGNR